MKSFINAFKGIKILVTTQRNARIHLVIFFLAVMAGLVLKISPAEWMIVIIVSGFVFACECFNTSIEQLSDIVSPGYNEKIRKAKDIAAGGVLISAITAAIAGMIIFIPRIARILF